MRLAGYQRLPAESGVALQPPLPGFVQVRVTSAARRRASIVKVPPPPVAFESTESVKVVVGAGHRQVRAFASAGSRSISAAASVSYVERSVWKVSSVVRALRTAVLASVSWASRALAQERRQRDRGQDPDDQDHDQELDEREAALSRSGGM